MREMQEDMGNKMRDTVTNLWNKTTTQISELDDSMKRAFDIKLETSV